MAACVPTRPSIATAPVATALSAPSVSPSRVAPAAPAVQPSSSPSAVAAPEVKIVEPAFRPPQQWTYTPTEVRIKVGTTVVWTNTGAVAHTVTADDGHSFDSGTIDPKAAFSLPITAPPLDEGVAYSHILIGCQSFT